MRLSHRHLTALIKLVMSTESDKGDCGSCHEHLAEFAESRLEGKEISDALREVQLHIEQCPCCRVELDALLDGLRGMDARSG